MLGVWEECEGGQCGLKGIGKKDRGRRGAQRGREGQTGVGP